MTPVDRLRIAEGASQAAETPLDRELGWPFDDLSPAPAGSRCTFPDCDCSNSACEADPQDPRVGRRFDPIAISLIASIIALIIVSIWIGRTFGVPHG